MRALFKLLIRYLVLNGTMYFRLFMPLILLGVLAEATIFSHGSSKMHYQSALALVSAFSVIQLIASGLMLLPTTIVDFKTSVLMKRIGSTNIKPWQFVFVVLLIFYVEASWEFVYVRLLATILYGWRPGFNWHIGFPSAIGIGYAWSLLTMALAVSFALVISSLAKNVRQVQISVQTIYFPILILSGGLIPVNIIYQSSFLKYLNYINPFRYSMEPYLQSQNAFGNIYSLSNTEMWIFPFIVLTFVVILLTVASRKLKWTS